MREGWRGKDPPAVYRAQEKLKLILEEKPVTVVVCCGNLGSLKEVTAQSRGCDQVGLFVQ